MPYDPLAISEIAEPLDISADFLPWDDYSIAHKVINAKTLPAQSFMDYLRDDN